MSDGSSGPPAPRSPLDRAALERVLARAAELQSVDTSETGGSLSDAQILDLGKEVGLTPEAMRQAIAEERGRVEIPPARGLTGALLGGSHFTAARVVPGKPEAVLAALDAFMRNELPFDLKRRFPDRMQWEPRRTFLDAMRAQLGKNAEGADLRVADEVAATVIAIDAERTHVRLDAILAAARARAATTSFVTVGAVGAAGLVLTAAMSLASVVVLPVLGVVGVIGVATSRASYRASAVRAAIALEQLLDRLEYGPAKQKRGLVDRLLG